MNISFFIGTLATGGAERQMSELARGMVEYGHTVKVVTLFSGGQISRELNMVPGIELISLWPHKSRNIIVRMFQLAAAPLILRRSIENRGCLYSMLEVTNFIAWLATRFKRNTCLIWGVRSSNMEGHWKMAIFDKLCAFVSPNIKLLIANSHSGLECLLKRNYRPQKYMVIPNGIDTERFQRIEGSRRRVRHELGVSLDQPLVGIVGRLNPMKDHSTFLSAAALVAKEVGDVKFLCVGGGADDYAEKLRVLTKELGLENRVIWLGDRSDIVCIYSALDILVSSSSYGEGFPNVVGEAMSCGLPCVVTDVGDSVWIVGDRTRVVKPRNSKRLAEAICKTLQRKEEVSWTEISRARIEEKYSLKKLVDLTERTMRRSCVVD